MLAALLVDFEANLWIRRLLWHKRLAARFFHRNIETFTCQKPCTNVTERTYFFSYLLKAETYFTVHQNVSFFRVMLILIREHNAKQKTRLTI